MKRLRFSLIAGAALSAACVEVDGGDGGPHDEDTEVISAVELRFAPEDGGAEVVASFRDPDGDGGMSGAAEAIVLREGMSYSLSIRFLNALVAPAADITLDVQDEAEEHLILVGGAGVRGPGSNASDWLVTQAYADMESSYGSNEVGEDLPLGLLHSIAAERAGTSEFRVVLRHLPDVGGTPQKSGELPELWAEGAALPGAVDVDVNFEIEVLAAEATGDGG